MLLEQLTGYLPAGLIVAGVLLLAWGQRDRVVGLLRRLRPGAGADQPTAQQRFELYYRLRLWAEAANHRELVQTLDQAVLPMIVRDKPNHPEPAP